MLATRHLTVVRPSNEKRTVQPPVRLPNSKYRTREYLTEREVNKLIEAAKSNRWGQRDFTMVLNATPSYRRPSSRAYFATNNPVSNPAGDPLRRFD